jgi:hypothetical protein
MKTGVLKTYLAIISKHRARINSIFSPGEMALYRAFGEKRMNAEIARLKREIEKLPALRAEVEKRRGEIELRKLVSRTLANHERAKLSDDILTNYCRRNWLPNGRIHVRWPTGDYLAGIANCVEKYLRYTKETVKRPRRLWKAFERLDKRVPSVQLVDQVNELANRAQKRLTEDKAQVRNARPLTLWLWLIDHPSARQLMKFDHGAQYAVKKFKQQITEERAQAEREAARERKRRQRARQQRAVAGFA